MSSDRSPPNNSATPWRGLTSAEAAQRLAAEGPNAVSEDHPHPLQLLIKKFWAPVPWMLEATILLQLALGKADEAAIIAILLIFNVVLAFVQEGRANRALALLKQRLAVQARVYRDARWQLIPARDLVSGDVVHLRMGDLAPADIRVLDGEILLDQSALTGESLPVEVVTGSTAYAGAIVKRGESTGEVIATGSRTYFGKTAELVRSAKTVSHLQSTILTIVKYLIVFDLILVAALFGYALAAGAGCRPTS